MNWKSDQIWNQRGPNPWPFECGANALPTLPSWLEYDILKLKIDCQQNFKMDLQKENNISGRGMQQKWKYSFNFVGESSLMRVRRFWVEMLTHSLSNSFRKASPTFCFENQNFFNYSEWYFIRQIWEHLNCTTSIVQYLTQ